jgi:O-antigen ligase
MSILLSSPYEIALLIIGLAGFFWLARKNFEGALYLIVFFMPLYLFKIRILFIPINVLEILIGLLFLIWLFEKKYKDIKLPDIDSFALPALLIILGAILSALTSANFNASAGILKSWFVVPVVFALMVATEIKKIGQIKKILGWLAGSSGLVAWLAIIYFLSGQVTFDGRLAAFYLSPNQLAMYLAPGFLISLALFSRTAKKEKIFFGTVLAGCGLALYLTFSYAAWIAILIAAFGWFFLGTKRKKKTAIVYGLLFLLLIGILLFSQSGGAKLDNLLHSARSSWQSRLMIWRAAWLITSDHPILGIGPGMFQEFYLVYQSRFPVPYLEWAVPQPHNIFLAFWLETGLLGLVAFFWLIIIFIKKVIKTLKGTDTGLSLILVTLMAYILIHGLIDTTYFKNDLAVVFWLIIALGMCLSMPGLKESEN